LAWIALKSLECECDFQNLGKEMLKKCDGLPLAIVALAGLLHTKYNMFDWIKVNECVSSRLMKSNGTSTYGSVTDMLELSYDNLPHNIRER